MKFRIYRVSDKPVNVEGAYVEKEEFTFVNTGKTIVEDVNYININTIDELIKLVKETDEILVSTNDDRPTLTIVDGRLE